MDRKRNGAWKWILAVALALGTVAGVAWYVVFRVNVFSLSVELQGEDTITLEYGQHYEELGAEVILLGTLFWQDGIRPEKAKLEIHPEVDEGKPGRYHVKYSAALRGLQAEAERTVCVIDTECPVITLTEDTEEPGIPYVEAGYTAHDNCDGDITERVVRTEEMGRILYAVVDSSGNPAFAEREVPFHDPLPPEIQLEGGENYRITTGRKYREPGFTAVDNVDGNLTEVVAVEGEVDWLTPGVYPITYTVSDEYGNQTVATRNVEVVAEPWPEMNWPEEKTVYLTFDDGPGAYTERLLDVLDQYGVKATFFVIDTGNYDGMRDIVNRGHSIGIHSVSHTYGQIYSSPEAFFNDLYGMQEIIYRETGVKTTLMRFPGGSSNTVSRHACEGVMSVLTEAVRNAGFQYFDWNVYSGDAGETKKAREVYWNVVNGICQESVSMVLQHDIHSYSVEAVEDIIVWCLDNGYRFEAIRDDTPGFHHEVNN